MARRAVRAALLAAALALAGCPATQPEPVCPDGPATCACTQSSDCGDVCDWLCSAARCRNLCRSTPDCGAGEVCEDGICRSDGCGSDAECVGGDLCLGGECRPPLPPERVASCFVQPVRLLLRDGARREVSIHSADASGRGVPYRGAVEWTVGDSERARIEGAVEVVKAVGGPAEGQVEIRARLPSGLDCLPAKAENYARAQPGYVRVVAADLQSSEPIAGARVVVERGDLRVTAKTDARGTVALEWASAQPATVSVYDVRHAYVTMIDVRSRDLAVFLKPFPSRLGFTGAMPGEAFDRLPELGETVHLAVFGSSIPGNLLDLQMATVFGDPVPTTLELGDVTARVPLPSGVVMGLNDRMFRDTYDVFAAPGLRTLWGLGGNGRFNDLFKAIAPLLVDGSEELQAGELVNTVLPLVGRFHSGIATGVQTPPDATLRPVALPLETPLRLKLALKLPVVPSFRLDGVETWFEGVLAVGGALYSPQGLVPLGLAAAVDAPAPDAPRDGVMTNPEPDGAPGVVPLRVAPLHSGLESSRHVLIALAASFSSLGPGGERVDAPLVLSGLVHLPPPLRYSGEGTPLEFPRPFLGVPSDPRFVGRILARGPAVEGAAFHRLDIGSAWGGEWYVYFPPGVDEVLVPTPPTGWDDRLKTPASEKPVDLILQTVRLNDAGAPLDYDRVISFGDDTLDDLTRRMDAFSTRELEAERP